MILPKEIRQKSNELFPSDREKQKIFCMGAAFALGYDLSDFQIEEPPQGDYPCQEALDEWLAYKKEKKQSYKPRGLAALKKKLLQMSGGNPEYAKQIVDFSMGNNYTGLFAPKDNSVNSYARQQQAINKAAAILTS